MSKNFKLFLISFISVIFFCLAINILQSSLENILFSKMIEKEPPSFFLANISHNHSQLDRFQISAKSAISVVIDKNGEERIIFKKNEKEKMEIASLTKLMTAIIAVEFYKPELNKTENIQVSKEAVSQPKNFSNLKQGEIFSVEDLLHIMLLESNNDAAFALTGPLKNPEAFIDLMNLKAKNIGMKKSSFFNSTGLDEEEKNLSNFSTALDLIKLTKYILNKPLLLNIISKKEYSLSDRVLRNTNQLLGETPGIIGGKTGFTNGAGECLILILKNEEKEDYILHIVLNSQDRYKDMRKLIDYTNAKYKYN